MQQDEIWDNDAAKSYDTPGTGMFSPDVLEPAVERLAQLAEGGAALEFAIGTGRVAVPLSERKVPVAGIEFSPAMVAELRTKVDEATIPVVIGDMATVTVPGSYSLVYLVYNTISNLLTQAQQVACFRNAARHLSPGGRFVVELGVPELRKLSPGSRRSSGSRRRAISASIPTTRCASNWSPIMSGSARAGRRKSSAHHIATSGRRSST
ncbi:class I SAM-dependent methyltransferase [Bosea sp. Tri-44]|uniref:class I SAM-dependent methyltransferase n=1 Tax=Bosea sp. Tri-44 TaxID=1972137 RepID=UPI0020C0F2A7|nr:class I SAM-dependent methyltransferase [Bosea sp. Tri-44]